MLLSESRRIRRNCCVTRWFWRLRRLRGTVQRVA